MLSNHYSYGLTIGNQFSSPVFVFYSNSETGHAYSINPDEYPFVQNGWNALGTNFYAFHSEVAETFPVHYWYNSYGYDRVLTIDNNDFPYHVKRIGICLQFALLFGGFHWKEANGVLIDYNRQLTLC